MTRSTPLLLTLLLTAALSHGADVVIHAVGDIMPGSLTPVELAKSPVVPTSLLEQAIPLLKDADIIFGNFEGAAANDATLADPCAGAKAGTCYRFLIPDDGIRALAEAGFNVLNIGNNHSNDAGPASIARTIQAIESNSQICPIGVLTRETCVVTTDSGVKVGFAGFSPHSDSSRASAANVVATVQELATRSDIVVVSFHLGAEGASAQHVTRREERFLNSSRGNIYALAHAAIDAGADLVLGHGPHVLRGLELYRRRLIVYSMGNFSTYGTFNTAVPNRYGAVFQITLNEDGTLQSCKIAGTQQDSDSETFQGGVTPVIDPDNNALAIIKALTFKDFPGGRLRFQGDGTVEAF